MDVRPAAGAPGLRGETKCNKTLGNMILLIKDDASKEVDIDLDEVLDIDDEIQRKIFIRVKIRTLYQNIIYRVFF